MLDLESVYVIHEFLAENNDEISLNIGEKVTILEKDEGYNDGWWQGRNERGDIGLFPITYTSKIPPDTRMKSKHVSLSSKNIQSLTEKSLSHPLLSSKPIEEWSSEQVAFWLLNIGFEQEIADNFKDQEITGDVLLELTLDSLKELQITTFGKRFKIHHAIHTLKQQQKTTEKVVNNQDIINSPRLSTLVDNDRQEQRQQRRPSSYQQEPPISPGGSSFNNKRSTINQDTINGRISSSSSSSTSRYSFMKMASNNKLHSILTQPPPLRKSSSEDTTSTSTDAPDMEGWLYKQGDKYKNWNKRWFVLKSNNLFYFKSPKAVRMKGIINLKGYRIDVDETIQPGKYCFMAQHDKERTFYFYTEHEKSMKDWLKALMKATIARDYATPVMSSSTIPTVSLEQARKMRPRPPSTIFHNTRHSSNNLSQHFSLMSIDEHRSSRHSDYSMGLKDSGYSGGRLSRSITGSSSDSSHTRQKMLYYDEDLIDPQQHNEKLLLSKESSYIDWINAYVQQKIASISDLGSGTVLLEFLENLTQKEIPRSITVPNNKMDCIISAYKFMSIEGIELNGACTIRDVANGNETKIMHLLEAIKYWYNQDNQCKLRALHEKL